MFGIGLMELAVIAVLAVLVMGPDKIPGLAKQAAGLMKSAKNATNSVRDELRTNLGPDYADLELTDLNPRSLVRKHVMEAWNDDHDDDQHHGHVPRPHARAARLLSRTTHATRPRRKPGSFFLADPLAGSLAARREQGRALAAPRVRERPGPARAAAVR